MVYVGCTRVISSVPIIMTETHDTLSSATSSSCWSEVPVTGFFSVGSDVEVEEPVLHPWPPSVTSFTSYREQSQEDEELAVDGVGTHQQEGAMEVRKKGRQ